MRQILTSLMWNPRPHEDRRCCSDEPVMRRQVRSSAPARWSRKLRVAIPSSVAVFRRTVASPVEPQVQVGTRVVTNRGREIGWVRQVLVDLPDGATSYAVQGDEAAPLILLPRSVIGPAPDPDVAVVDERVMHLRRSA
jgi:sporulation protein YlmC with PRC-barrel domain